MLKKLTYFLLSGTLTVTTVTALFAGCSDNSGREKESFVSPRNVSALSDTNGERAAESEEKNSCTVNIDGEIDITGEGAWFEGNILTIFEGGEYRLSGNIVDGCVYIETDEDVKLILDGLNVYNSEGAAVYCYKAKNLYIELAGDRENFFSDCAEYTFEGKNESAEENEPDAALYSNSDITFGGSGVLKINGSYGSGIRCGGGISLNGGTITVNAVGHGIKGGPVSITDGNVTLTAGKNGIYSQEEDKGEVVISGGKITVDSSEDCISSAEGITVTGGTVTLFSEEGEGFSAVEEPNIEGGKVDFFRKTENAA